MIHRLMLFSAGVGTMRAAETQMWWLVVAGLVYATILILWRGEIEL